MLYSTNAGGLFRTARQLPTLAPGGSTGTADGPRVVLMLRRVETTDPRELTEAFLNVTLGYEEEGGAQMPLAGMDNKLYY